MSVSRPPPDDGSGDKIDRDNAARRHAIGLAVSKPAPPVEIIVAGTATKEIVTGAAQERIVSGTAAQFVIELAAAHGVNAAVNVVDANLGGIDCPSARSRAGGRD